MAQNRWQGKLESVFIFIYCVLCLIVLVYLGKELCKENPQIVQFVIKNWIWLAPRIGLIAILIVALIVTIIFRKSIKRLLDKRWLEEGAMKTSESIIKLIWSVILVTGLFFLSRGINGMSQKITTNTSPYSFFVALIVFYASLCLKRLVGTEKGIKEFLGKPYAFVDSGLHFIFFPIEKIVIYPKEEQRVDVPEQEVVTVPGIVTSSDGTTSEKCSATAITLDAMLYYSWPSGNDLIIAYEKFPKPYQRERVKMFFEAAIKDGIRAAASQKTWRYCTHDDFVNDISINLADRPITRAGEMFNYRVALPKVQLPDNLKNALVQPQIAELEKDATVTKADGDATARTKLLEALRGDPNGIIYESLLTLSGMAKDPSAKLIYQFPDQLQRALSGVFGGPKSPQDIINSLGGPDKIEELLRQHRPR